MQRYEFDNLTDLYYQVNRDFLTIPHEIVEYKRGVQSFIDDLIISVGSTDLDLNLHEIGFNPDSKWRHLIRSYIDAEEYFSFWEKVVKSKGTSIQFRFKNREGPNGPCLIALVLTRPSGKVPWNAAKVLWRTAELQRKFAADLVLINRIFEEIPEEAKPFVQIEKTTFFLAQAFQSCLLIGPLIFRFVDREEIDMTHPHSKGCIKNYDDIYNEETKTRLHDSKFAPLRRMKGLNDKIEAGTIPEWVPSDVSIIAELTKKKK